MAADMKRFPALSKKISNITETDVRVRVMGTLVDKKDTVVIVDDGTGKIDVTFEEPPKNPVGSRVRIMGRVIPSEGAVNLQGELIQIMDGIDLDLLKKAEEIGAYV